MAGSELFRRAKRWSSTVTILTFSLLVTPPLTGAHPVGPSGNPSVIHACVKTTGLLRIVGEAEECNRGETPLHWNAGRFIDLGLTVFDTRTNLEWEKKTTAVGSGQNLADLHDVDNFYLWSDAIGSWIAAVNAEGFAGHTDWRVPTRTELEGIRDFGLLHPDSGTPCGPFVLACLDASFGPTIFGQFPGTQAYWTSTPHESDAARAYSVEFAIGFFNNSQIKESFLYVRAVRGGQ
jgi:Protein of unknown function (DUF1566)